MRYSLFFGAALAASVSTVSAEAGCQNDGGNWYCSAVDLITYSGFATSGTYNLVNSMSGGKCGSVRHEFSGKFGPLSEELSMHFRGPMNLYSLAVYNRGSGKPKRELKPSIHERRHGHSHQRFHEKRAIGDTVVATIDGQVVSWANAYGGGAPAPTPAPGAKDPQVKSSNGGGSKGGDKPKDSKPHAPVKAGAGQWGRVAFFNTDSQDAQGVSFLNNDGGWDAGVDQSFGAALKALGLDDSFFGISSKPNFPKDSTIPDGEEMIIMSDKKCENGDCGFTRPGAAAFHGFGGEEKIFLFRVSMPYTGNKGTTIYDPKDMPAIWLLNAKIPLTSQYPMNPDCSCWKSGCGEFDVLEVLAPGDGRCKSTYHTEQSKSGGSSYYFDRPEEPVTVAVVFNGEDSTLYVKVLKNMEHFPETLSHEDIKKLCADNGKSNNFALAS
ncbi:Target of Sbf [Trichophyton interdigitale]|uniref:glucan endo-1,3-beta-D-glucosidase n=1 Tax=Trichophyton interdigitale TaxID=101480 RepID=A0A9P5CXP6_9EURO|nr:Target of Sbf [Trichophyton interdigitale]KAF3899118.1 Target of Sbf [Trichophyton interdigitale]KAG8208949.1 Target of Sbf [Trichophyton interdigitale]